MPEFDLDELERLAKAATPVPWRYDPYPSWDFMFRITGRRKEFLFDTHIAQNGEANAAYVVAACNSLPTLIAENRALREQVRELERQNAFFLKALKENFVCPYSICKYDVGSDLDEWECTAENNGECWIQATKEAGE